MNHPDFVLPRRTALKGGVYPSYLQPGELYVILGDTATSLLIGTEYGTPILIGGAGYEVATIERPETFLNAAGTIILAHANPVLSTIFFDVQPLQRFTVQSRNSNTTIQHNERTRLKGGVDLLITPDSCVMFQADENAWVTKQVG